MKDDERQGQSSKSNWARAKSPTLNVGWFDKAVSGLFLAAAGFISSYSPFFFLFSCNREDKINKPMLTATKPKFPSEQQLPFSHHAKPLRCCPALPQQEHPRWDCSQTSAAAPSTRTQHEAFPSARAAFQPESGSHPSTFTILLFFFFCDRCHK